MTETLDLFPAPSNKDEETVNNSSKRRRNKKSATAYRTISEVANSIGVATHVLRFWETKFSEIQPLKRGGGRRYYRPEDVAIIKHIQDLLHNKGYTIKGVQAVLSNEKSKVCTNSLPENSNILPIVLDKLYELRKTLAV